jgi:hypothetical protein
LFDVNDLILNVVGTGLGFWLAKLLPDFSKLQKRDGINTNPGIVQRAVVFLSDCLFSGMVALVAIFPLYLVDTSWQNWSNVFQITSFVILQFLVPLIFKGKTVFGGLTGVSLDDRERGWLHRVLFYAARAGLLSWIMFASSWVAGVLVVVVVIVWVIFRKMPYKVVDIFFHKK